MKNLKKVIACFALLAFIHCFDVNVCYAQGSLNGMIDENSIFLPAHNSTISDIVIPFERTEGYSNWKEFSEKHGKWNISIDRATNSPRLAYGYPIKIQGFDTANENNIEMAALSFLKEHQDLFNINVENLSLMRKEFAAGKWYVTFKQYCNGIEVLLSNIDLRISADCKIMYFDVEYYNGIDINATPGLSYSQAISLAQSGMKSKFDAEAPLSEQKPCILPLRNGGTVSYGLVYKVILKSPENNSNYVTYVDSHSGRVLWRFNATQNFTEINVKGSVKPSSPLDKESLKPMPHINVKVGDKTLTSDSEGRIQATITTSVPVNASLEGRWAKTEITKGKQTGKFTGTIHPDEPLEIVFNDQNTHRYERNLYYYTNYIHDFYKALDPEMNCMDFQMFVRLAFESDQTTGGSPNAYSVLTGDTLGFINCQVDSMRMADDPGILFHEYGHAINIKFYMERGREDGMINATTHEALADITQAAILDRHLVGYGVWTYDSTKTIRNMKNDLVYPDSLKGRSHYDSQILSGAFWDLRELTSLETLQRLHHFARYGLPDGVSLGEAFYKWFIEVLTADDDDGDLSNGTPHANEIITAFSRHKIGPNLFFSNNFSHTPLTDTKDVINPYPVEFSFGKNSLILKPESAAVVYQVKFGNNLSDAVTVPAMLSADDETYISAIPPQPKGSEVLYYIIMKDPYTKQFTKFSTSNGKEPYSFLVGYQPALFEDFENGAIWSSGSAVDNAKVGIWEKGKPEEFTFFGAPSIKPLDNHTNGGANCYVTGIKSPKGSENQNFSKIISYVTDGQTTLTSPIWNMSELENVIIQFYCYFGQIVITMDPSQPQEIAYFRIELTNDGGKNWTTAYHDTTSGAPKWKKTRIRFADYLHLTNECAIRFIYKNGRLYGFPLAIGAVSIDDIGVLTANESIISSVRDNDKSFTSTNAYPNPFTENSSIEFELAVSGFASISFFNIFGAEVYSETKFFNAGNNQFEWSGRNLNNDNISAGVYYYRIFSENQIITGKIIKQ